MHVHVCVYHRERERVGYGSQKGLQAVARAPAALLQSVWIDVNFGQLAPRAVTSEVCSKSLLQGNQKQSRYIQPTSH